jgi:MFS family permease
MSDKLRCIYMACAFAVTLMFSLGNTTQGTLLTDFAEFYGIGALQQSFISAAASLGMAAALCLLLAGSVRVTKNALYVAAVGVVCLSLGLIGTMPGFALFLAFYALLGVAFGFIDAIGSSIVADVSAPDRLTRNMGMLHAFYGIGGILGPLLIRFTADLASAGNGKSGASGAAYLLAAAAAVLFIANILAYRAIRRASPGTLKAPEPLKADGLSAFLRSGAMPLLWVTGLCGAYLNVVTFRMAQYISVDFGSPALGALSLSALWAGIVVSRIAAPRVKLKLRAYLIGGMAGAAVFTALSVAAGNAYAVIAGAFLSGIACGAVIPMCISELCLYTPGNTLLASGSALLALYVVQLIGALVTGALTPDSSLGVGLYAAAAYSAVGAVAAALYRPAEGK